MPEKIFRVAIGSDNPAKSNAVKQAFNKMMRGGTWEFRGVKVSSGVSDQPRGHEETILGARNRANAARERLDADFGVGLEGGLEELNYRVFDIGWICVVDRAGRQ